jgi:hypothetical protein
MPMLTRVPSPPSCRNGQLTLLGVVLGGNPENLEATHPCKFQGWQVECFTGREPIGSWAGVWFGRVLDCFTYFICVVDLGASALLGCSPGGLGLGLDHAIIAWRKKDNNT